MVSMTTGLRASAAVSLALSLLIVFVDVNQTWDVFRTLRALSAVALVTSSVVLLHMSSLKPAESHTAKTLLLQYLFNGVMAVMGKRNFRRLLQKTRDVTKTQQELLLRILQENSDTEYGLKYGFSAVRTQSDFKAKVPLSTYSCYEPYINRIIQGKLKMQFITIIILHVHVDSTRTV